MAEVRVPIVIVLTSFEVGGTEHQTVELVRRLDPRRFQVSVACFHRGGPLMRKLPPEVAIEEFRLRGFRRPGSMIEWARFARWCRAGGVRLVHTCDLYANIFGLTAAAAARVPVVIGSRREVITGDKSPMQLAVQRLAYRAAHVVVANSSSAAGQLRREGVPERKIRVIPNGVDLQAFAPVDRRAPLRRIVMVANLRPEKRHDVLIDAMPRILAEHPEAEVVIAGAGPLAESIARRTRDRSVSDRVRLIGRCDDVPGLLAASDIFVLTSRSEAMPNAVIEAMAAALPVVATRVGGIPELVSDGETGVLIPPDDPAALAAAVSQLMAHPEQALALGRAAREHITRTLSYSRMVGSVEDLYLSALEPSGVAGLAPAADPGPNRAGA